MKTYAQDLVDIETCKSIIRSVVVNETPKIGKKTFFATDFISKSNIIIIRIVIYISDSFLQSNIEVPMWQLSHINYTDKEAQILTKFPKLFKDSFQKLGYNISDSRWFVAPDVHIGGLPCVDYIAVEIDVSQKLKNIKTDPMFFTGLSNPSVKEIQVAIENHPESIDIIFQNDTLFEMVLNNTKLSKEMLKSMKKHRLKKG